MKKALLITDGSIDTALSLNNWRQAQSEPINLTVVSPFTLSPAADQPLNAAAYRQAKQTATEKLNRWLDLLSEPRPSLDWPGQSRSEKLHTELLLGEPERVLTIHLLLRQYDYLLVEWGQTELVSAFRRCQHQISTQLRCLSLPEEDVFAPDRVPQSTHALPRID